MNLTRLRWTKNIVRDDGIWAYSHADNIRIDENFNLHWKPDAHKNAARPEKDDLAILRQKTKVTHLVKFVDNTEPKHDFSNQWLYRVVKVVWMADVWGEPPAQTEIFDCSLKLHGGNIMELENIKALSENWKNQGGMSSFNRHIQRKLKLQLSSV